jgi:hypothetical protein
MRTVVFGALVGAGLVMAAVGATPDRSQRLVARPRPDQAVQAEGQLIALSTTVNDKYQQLTVIDPKLRSMSVYHVELATGNIELRCVRNIHWDLQMECFNGNGLLPPEIRAMLEPR